ncbi:MAG: hypothetical protein ACPGOY_04745 [Rhodospirillaceae bacterium]
MTTTYQYGDLHQSMIKITTTDADGGVVALFVPVDEGNGDYQAIQQAGVDVLPYDPPEGAAGAS